MRTLILNSLLVQLALAAPAKADFVVASAPTIAADPAAAAPASQPDVAAVAPPRRLQTLQSAIGFGDDVPLAFAVRQIVPHGVSVKYGPGASATTLVSWKGGQPWNQVLVAAVRPARLRIVMGATSVLIRK